MAEDEQQATKDKVLSQKDSSLWDKVTNAARKLVGAMPAEDTKHHLENCANDASDLQSSQQTDPVQPEKLSPSEQGHSSPTLAGG